MSETSPYCFVWEQRDHVCGSPDCYCATYADYDWDRGELIEHLISSKADLERLKRMIQQRAVNLRGKGYAADASTVLVSILKAFERGGDH